MKGRAIIPLVIGLAVGIVAIKIFADVLRKAKGANTGETVKVVCAATDIAPTMQITDTMLELKDTPRSLVPQLSFSTKEDVIGRVTSLTIPRGIPVVQTLLAPEGTPPGLAVRIRDGYRAVAVKIDEFAGVAGWIKPGSHVDVVAVMQTFSQKKGQGTLSKVILENVEVLAVGQDIGSTGETAASVTKSVTLLVRPEEVPKLHLAATKGKLRLAMRNQRDFSASSKFQMTDNDLLNRSGKTNSGQGQSEGQSQKSFLTGLFRKQPKIVSNKTDKDLEGLMPTQANVSSQDEPWRVELLNGAQSEDIWFDDDSKKARRMNQGATEDSPATGMTGAVDPNLLLRAIKSSSAPRQ